MKRRITKTHFEGKKIKKIDISCVNEIVFHFTDRTKRALSIDKVGLFLGMVETKTQK